MTLDPITLEAPPAPPPQHPGCREYLGLHRGEWCNRPAPPPDTPHCPQHAKERAAWWAQFLHGPDPAPHW